MLVCWFQLHYIPRICNFDFAGGAAQSGIVISSYNIIKPFDFVDLERRGRTVIEVHDRAIHIGLGWTLQQLWVLIEGGLVFPLELPHLPLLDGQELFILLLYVPVVMKLLLPLGLRVVPLMTILVMDRVFRGWELWDQLLWDPVQIHFWGHRFEGAIHRNFPFGLRVPWYERVFLNIEILQIERLILN